jgi:ubiquinone/menaquinone biosynthesis C-methylase UbiE
MRVTDEISNLAVEIEHKRLNFSAPQEHQPASIRRTRPQEPSRLGERLGARDQELEAAFMHRTVIPELLDTDAGTRREVERSLADLKTINRYLGGRHTMTRLILRVASQAKCRKISWLDVGGGTGDLAALTSEALRPHGIELQTTLLDRMPSHMSAPFRGQRDASTAGRNGLYASVGGDALALPFREDSFDVVSSSLFVHHLEPQQVVEFARQALRIARHAFLINDLIRHPLHLALAYAGYAFYRSPLTRHDSVASVRRAYTLEEIEHLLRQTDAERIELRKFFLFRMGVIAWKKPSLT